MQTKSTVYQIRLNKIAFEIVARALYSVSLGQDRLVALPTLIENFLASNPNIEEIYLAIFADLPVLSGDIVVRVRVAGVHSETLNALRTALSVSTGRRCTARDVIIFACSSVIAFPA